MEIPLTKGKTAIVDHEDYDRLKTSRWHTIKVRNALYAISQPVISPQKRANIYMHAAIMGAPPQGMQIDHIDGNGLNNQKSNLRFVTPRQNNQNRHHKKSSRYPGVCFDKIKGKWVSKIWSNNKQIHLGRFNSEEAAFFAYSNALKSIGQSFCQDNSGSTPEKLITLLTLAEKIDMLSHIPSRTRISVGRSPV